MDDHPGATTSTITEHGHFGPLQLLLIDVSSSRTAHPPSTFGSFLDGAIFLIDVSEYTGLAMLK